MKARPRSTQQRISLAGTDRSDELNVLVQARLYQPVEVLRIVDDAGDDQPLSRALRQIDRQMDAFIRMNPPHEDEVVSAIGREGEVGQVDAVINGRDIG